MFHHVEAGDETFIKICVWFPLKELQILIGCYVTELGSDFQIAHIEIHMYVKILIRLLAAWVADSGKQRQYPCSGP